MSIVYIVNGCYHLVNFFHNFYHVYLKYMYTLFLHIFCTENSNFYNTTSHVRPISILLRYQPAANADCIDITGILLSLTVFYLTLKERVVFFWKCFSCTITEIMDIEYKLYRFCHVICLMRKMKCFITSKQLCLISTCYLANTTWRSQIIGPIYMESSDFIKWQ
jgi:hypothetical protein